jgi:hypothetical protein
MSDATTLSTIQQVFKLSWAMNYVDDDLDHEAWFREIPDMEEPQFWKAQEIDLPEGKSIDFESPGDILQDVDWLYNDKRWPLMSLRMLNILLSVGEFSYQALPVTMFNTTQYWNEDTQSSFQSDEKNYNFILLNLLEKLDIFDWENSIYEPDEITPQYPGWMEKMVFKVPENGFPPIFKVSTHSARLYVSAGARAALEAAGIKGVEFDELEGT